MGFDLAKHGLNSKLDLRPNLVSFRGEQTVDREEKKREEEEQEEKKKRRRKKERSSSKAKKVWNYMEF